MAISESEALHHMRENSPLNRVRIVLSGRIGAMEQAEQQYVRPTAIQRRAAEFDAVLAVLASALHEGLVVEPLKENK